MSFSRTTIYHLFFSWTSLPCLQAYSIGDIFKHNFLSMLELEQFYNGWIHALKWKIHYWPCPSMSGQLFIYLGFYVNTVQVIRQQVVLVGRGNQYWLFYFRNLRLVQRKSCSVKVLYCKLPTIGKQLLSHRRFGVWTADLTGGRRVCYYCPTVTLEWVDDYLFICGVLCQHCTGHKALI